MIHHWEMAKWNLSHSDSVLSLLALIDWNRYPASVDEVVVAEVVDLHFGLVVLCKVPDDVLE